MRVAVGKTVRAGPGDRIEIQARLPKTEAAALGRLYVFAKETRGEKFSPYVPNLHALIEMPGEPQMFNPLSLRLSNSVPEREIAFTADIYGWFQVFQECDTNKDPLVKLRIKRRSLRYLRWREWLLRRLPWRPLSV